MGAALIIASGSEAWLNRFFLMNPVAVWFGLISYPLYLWHWPILSFLQIVEGEVPHRDARILAVALAVFLAWITFKFIETPIRRQNKNAPRAQHLVILLCLIGGTAFLVEHLQGVQSRKAVVEYNSNLDELKRTVAKEKECLEFLGMGKSKFDYCKLGEVGSEGVVAVIGDSHAHVAFPGISEGLAKFGLTTILMANSSCPPLIGSPWGRSEDERRFCLERIEEIISATKSLKKLDSVIIFTRGPIYWEGHEPSSAKRREPALQIGPYFSGLQRTVDSLKVGNVDVIYVTENPELKYQARSCLPRPFNTGVSRKCDQDLSVVLKRQKEYRDQLGKISNAGILDSNKAFCDDKNRVCFAVSPQHQLLYADEDHLSVFGSGWQYERIIEPIYEKRFGM